MTADHIKIGWEGIKRVHDLLFGGRNVRDDQLASVVDAGERGNDL